MNNVMQIYFKILKDLCGCLMSKARSCRKHLNCTFMTHNAKRRKSVRSHCILIRARPQLPERWRRARARPVSL